MDTVRGDAKKAIVKAVPGSEDKDADFIFFDFALAHLPAGLLGLLVAVILSATMSSISSAVSSLGDHGHRLPPARSRKRRWTTRRPCS